MKDLQNKIGLILLICILLTASVIVMVRWALFSNKYGSLETCVSKSTAQFTRCVDGRLKEITLSHGIGLALEAATTFTRRHTELLSYSHDLAHTIGLNGLKFSYGKGDAVPPVSDSSDGTFSVGDLRLIDQMGRSLVECTSWGVMGCMHGVIEGSISHIPKERRTDVVRRACMNNPLIQSNQVYINHCLHWAGHGMAIFTEQTLAETLAVCESLSGKQPSINGQLCISGVFHAGTFSGDSEGAYLDNLDRVYRKGDPYYPCRDIPERFREQCYNQVPGRSGTRELRTIFQNCMEIPESDAARKHKYIRACYDSAANVLSMQTKIDAGTIVERCRVYSDKDYLPYCYGSAMRYWFLRDPTPENTAPSGICRLAEETAKPICYQALGSVIYESSYSMQTVEELCGIMAESAYYNRCITLAEF